ncbi:MAG: class I SAM-dependent methyltransferase, partial [Melioribacteraceae bacterium]
MPEKHFYEQKSYTKEYILPYFLKHIPDFTRKKVLEVGCAEGGLLAALQELGMSVRGVELSPERAELALEKDKSLNIIVGD